VISAASRGRSCPEAAISSRRSGRGASPRSPTPRPATKRRTSASSTASGTRTSRCTHRSRSSRCADAFYNEDDLVDYGHSRLQHRRRRQPRRFWVEGRAQLHVKVRAPLLGTLTLKLADSLAVRSIISYEYGRLFGIRVKNQNTLVVNLPTLLARDSQLTVTVTYAGRLQPQTPDRERSSSSSGKPTTRRCNSHRRRASSTAIAASGIRRRRSATTRPRGSRLPCRRRSSASPADNSNRLSRSAGRQGSHAEPQGLRLQRRAADSLPGIRAEPLLAGRNRDRCVRAGQGGDCRPRRGVERDFVPQPQSVG